MQVVMTWTIEQSKSVSEHIRRNIMKQIWVPTEYVPGYDVIHQFAEYPDRPPQTDHFSLIPYASMYELGFQCERRKSPYQNSKLFKSCTSLEWFYHPGAVILVGPHHRKEYWIRPSLLLELISSAYLTAVPGFELCGSNMRGERGLSGIPHRYRFTARSLALLRWRSMSRTRLTKRSGRLPIRYQGDL
ncbi:hypothetical protein CLF_110643 [Clonorchis sinensis]|uniref:Uncharacterized protein n=1 Tax=Clonorchis sinensis TaxID=79923 RepID=G7YKZ2_CLOSI|nr:hypothetical protein CLF_110643 [Clonorchis sinensis]